MFDKMNHIFVVAIFALWTCVLCASEIDKAEILINAGRRFEALGQYDKAAARYADAAALGNAVAFRLVGDLNVNYRFARLKPETPEDYAHGYDKWIVSARELLDGAERMYDKAMKQGDYSAELGASRMRLRERRAEVGAIEQKVLTARALGEDVSMLTERPSERKVVDSTAPSTGSGCSASAAARQSVSRTTRLILETTETVEKEAAVGVRAN